MANRRMFSNSVVNSDSFLDMPHSTQLLYFHLGMHADDDGFLDNYNGVMRQHGFKTDDLKVLIAKGFIIPFESGVIVIRHWRVNNQIRKDRYHPTSHRQERQQLEVLSNEQYALLGSGCQLGNQMATEYSLAENSKAENREEKGKKIGVYDGARVFIPSKSEIKAYCDEQGIEIDVERFYNYYASRGWRVKNGEPVQSWTALVRCWHTRDSEYKAATTQNTHTDDDGNGGTVL